MYSFTISATSLPAIVISSGMRPFVRRAAEDVAGDIGKIFGARPTIVEGAAPMLLVDTEDAEAVAELVEAMLPELPEPKKRR